ncbi:glycosyl hydrolase [Dysgonomonas reticulitermitis]
MKIEQYKTTIKLLMLLSVSFVFLSCQDDYDVTGEQKHTEPPVLISTDPASGGSISPFSDGVRLVFDREVTVDLSKIQLPGAVITGSSLSENTLTLAIDDMEDNTDYTLTIPKGTIKGVPGILNQEDIIVKFKAGAVPEITKTLVTQNASSQAQKVYNFLMEKYRSNIISGAMARVNWNTEEADRVYRWTGKYPALNTFDYVHHYASPASWIDYSNTTVVENWWNNNGLVSIMWHWNVPASEGSSEYAFYTDGTSFDVTKAVTDGTYENTQVKSDLNKIADYLLLLQAKNVPVIWRPLHEAAGGWFWWGAKGSDAYKKLWIMMFDTFKTKGINNLIWVWTTETGDESWYPGDTYVDIIGRDIYNNTDASSLYSEYRSIRKLHPNKMVTLSECGNVANIADQWNALAKWSWFMPWYDYDATDESVHMHATKEFWINAFNSDKVITRDMMPSLK